MRPLFIISICLLIACNPTKEENTSMVVEAATQQKSRKLNPDEFEKLMDSENTVLLDVRTPAEVARGYLPGAVVIDYGQQGFEEKIAGLDKEKTYLLYCASGGRSSNTQKLMEDQGFSEVYDLDGGISAWISKGKTVVLPGN